MKTTSWISLHVFRRSQAQNVLCFHVTCIASVIICPHANCFHTCVWSSCMAWARLFLSAGFLSWIADDIPDEATAGLLRCSKSVVWFMPRIRNTAIQPIQWIISGTLQTTSFFWASSRNTMHTDWYPLLCKQMIRCYCNLSSHNAHSFSGLHILVWELMRSAGVNNSFSFKSE